MCNGINEFSLSESEVEYSIIGSAPLLPKLTATPSAPGASPRCDRSCWENKAGIRRARPDLLPPCDV